MILIYTAIGVLPVTDKGVCVQKPPFFINRVNRDLHSSETVEVCVCIDKYIRKIIATLGHHFKPSQDDTIKSKEYNGRHSIEDTTPVICIAFNFQHPFLSYNSYFSNICF